MLKIRNLNKTFGKVQALDNLNLDLEDGDFFEKEEFPNISSNIITDRFTFFAKVIHSSELGITTKVFSTELQPIINSKYVPFFYQDLNTKDNVKRREKYNGVPFI